jgi:hypothetical protein
MLQGRYECHVGCYSTTWNAAGRYECHVGCYATTLNYAGAGSQYWSEAFSTTTQSPSGTKPSQISADFDDQITVMLSIFVIKMIPIVHNVISNKGFQVLSWN